jgi:BASS family bile acid:Na+ symporter
MLQLLVDYGVPINLFVLMLVAGTEITSADFAVLRQKPIAVLLGSAGQLIILPMIGLLIVTVLSPSPAIAAGIMLLTLCPGGGISNYYCYFARLDVLLSAAVTALSTMLSLVTIPLWLRTLPTLPVATNDLPAVPVGTIIGQRLIFMVLPLALGMGLRHGAPEWSERNRGRLRSVSLTLICILLVLATWTIRTNLASLAAEILVAATTFVLAAMTIGWIVGFSLNRDDRAVLVVESGVRNIAVALILGTALLPRDSFGILATFLTGYFVVEIAMMLFYARWLATRAALPNG